MGIHQRIKIHKRYIADINTIRPKTRYCMSAYILGENSEKATWCKQIKKTYIYT